MPVFHLDPMLWRRTIDLAEQALGLSDPNPRVGCVIVDPHGRLLGEGHTQAAGAAHAEVMAMRDAESRGHDVRGATAVVSLEPCSHHGRTPPCCDALIDAGIARVAVALEDPNPLVAGQGLARLKSAGVAVEVLGGEYAVASRELNIGFFSRMTRALPWVRMKVAASLDGRTALPDGRSQWITGEAARRDGHRWRKRAGAVVTGIGTVREDNPRMDVRLVSTAVQPLRVVVDSRLEITGEAQILRPPGHVLIYTSAAEDARVQQFQRAHPEVQVQRLAVDPGGKNDLKAMMRDLAAREINEVHVEAGEKLNASLLRAGLVDELLVYLAPRLMGDGRGIAALGTLAGLEQTLDFRVHQLDQVGSDIRCVLRRVASFSGAGATREPTMQA